MMPLQSDNRPDTAMPWQTRAANAGMAAALCLIALAGNAAPVTVRVTDSTGQPLPDAVVYAEPAGGQSLPKQLKPAEIEQRKRAFLPLVTVVQTGTSISFPNNDSVRHHVYSFSPPKTFELKLYSGVPAMPVVFDKPGTVVIGCNIHDRMTAYIHVVPTPHFAKTDAAGLARIEGMAFQLAGECAGCRAADGLRRKRGQHDIEDKRRIRRCDQLGIPCACAALRAASSCSSCS